MRFLTIVFVLIFLGLTVSSCFIFRGSDSLSTINMVGYLYEYTLEELRKENIDLVEDNLLKAEAFKIIGVAPYSSVKPSFPPGPIPKPSPCIPVASCGGHLLLKPEDIYINLPPETFGRIETKEGELIASTNKQLRGSINMDYPKMKLIFEAKDINGEALFKLFEEEGGLLTQMPVSVQ